MRDPTGVSRGGTFLHDSHVRALLPLAAAPDSAGWGPLLDDDDAWNEVTRRLAECGALLPPVATLPQAVLLERLSDPQLEAALAYKDLLLCPYCKIDKKRGLIDEAMRTRLPAGLGSEIAAWAAEYAGSGGFHYDHREQEGGEPPLWTEDEEAVVVETDKRTGGGRAGL